MARFLSITPTSELTFKIMYLYCSQSFKSFTYLQHTLLPFVWLPSSLPMLVLYRVSFITSLDVMSIVRRIVSDFANWLLLMAFARYRGIFKGFTILKHCLESVLYHKVKERLRIVLESCAYSTFVNRLSHFPESLRMVTSHRDVSWFLFLG